MSDTAFRGAGGLEFYHDLFTLPSSYHCTSKANVPPTLFLSRKIWYWNVSEFLGSVGTAGEVGRIGSTSLGDKTVTVERGCSERWLEWSKAGEEALPSLRTRSELVYWGEDIRTKSKGATLLHSQQVKQLS